MADGYRFPQQGAANYYYPQNTQQHHHPRHISRNTSPPNSIRSNFNTETPSPSRSPDLSSSTPNYYGMFGQGHQQGQHSRVNGGPGGQRMPMMYNYGHQNTHQHQTHNQHHQNLQQDHAGHNGNGAVLGHHSSYSSGVISSSTPNFAENSLQNGHVVTARGGQAQQINDHWAEQLKMHKEIERAHSVMIEQHAPNHYARTRQHENRSLPADVNSNTFAITSTQETEMEDRGRPSNIDGGVKRQDWHNLDMSGQGLRILTPPLFAYTFLHELYVASNKLTYLPAEVGQLRQLRNLDASNNLLTELPLELGMLTYIKQLLLFDNNIRTLPFALGSLFQLEMLGIEGNPLDPDTKQLLMDQGTKALITHLRENAPVHVPPYSRMMLDMDGAPVSASQERFKVFSYNILCDKYATAQQYGYTPSSALAWDYRKEQVLQEIQAAEPDIICLQEVSQESFDNFFCAKLAYGEYKGTYWPKSRVRTMAEKDAKLVDGCATFWKGSKYILLDKQLIDFAQIALSRPDMKGMADIFNRLQPRDDIAIVTFLENRLTGSRTIVVNAHLYWNPRYADVKVIQTALLMDTVSKLAEKYARWPPQTDKKIYKISNEEESEEANDEPTPEPAPSVEYGSSTQVPLLICGDFNSTSESGVVKLLSDGSLKPDHKDIQGYKYGNYSLRGIDHPFSLRSAYANLNGTPDDLPFTNYTPGFVGVIDYIWYSTNSLEVTALLGPVNPEYMKRQPGFPNYHFPSDHISLFAEFAVKGRKDKKALTEPDFGPQRERRH